MKKRKTLQELTIKDNFMFGAVMSIEENCIAFLELVLGFQIAQVRISKEKSLIYHPEYKGVRLDIYAEDEKNTHYNVEMQVKKKSELGKRSRYYHSQIDMECLLSGSEYEVLPNTFVIFVCDFDPFGMQHYCYTFSSCCEEIGELRLDDGRRTIFLSTKGKNVEEVPKELVKFLQFVEADLGESEIDFGDCLVKQFQKSVQSIKKSREMGERYMIFEEMMRDERNEGRMEATRENIFELLEDVGEIPDELRNSIENVTDLQILKNILKIASRTDSVETFVAGIEPVLVQKEEN